MDDWRPIETAPKDGTPILTAARESIQDSKAPKPFYAVAYWVVETAEHWEWVDDKTKKLVEVDNSHWSNWELPEAWMPITPHLTNVR